MKRFEKIIWLVACFVGFMTNVVMISTGNMWAIFGLILFGVAIFLWIISLCGYCIVREEAKFCPQCGATVPNFAVESS